MSGRRRLVAVSSLAPTPPRHGYALRVCHLLAELGRDWSIALISPAGERRPDGVERWRVLPPAPGWVPTVAFTGVLGHLPDVAAALHRVSAIWSRVRALLPDAQLVLAGRAPAPEVLALAMQPGVAMQSDVPDMAGRRGARPRAGAGESLLGRGRATTVSAAGQGVVPACA